MIWLDKVDWDDVLKPLTTVAKIHKKNCSTIKIPRWIQFSPSCNVAIYGFSDASEKAYSATLYVRIQLENLVFICLLASKTRVAWQTLNVDLYQIFKFKISRHISEPTQQSYCLG